MHKAVHTDRLGWLWRVRSTRASSWAGLASNSDAVRIVWRTNEVSAAACTPLPVTSPMMIIQPPATRQTS